MISQMLNLNNYPPIMVAVTGFSIGVLVTLLIEYFTGE